MTHSPGAFAAACLPTFLVLSTVLVAGCTRNGEYQSDSMWNDSRLRPMEEGSLPGEASSARPLVPGAMARGELRTHDPFATGRIGDRLLVRLPVRVTRDLLSRGQERFDIYCSPCHGRVGDGRGMIVQRGFPRPPDYALARLRQAPDGHFFDVITHGYGVMYSYAGRVPVPDRWAIVAYIRLLQQRRPEVPAQDTRTPETVMSPGVGYRPAGR